jgi:DNA-binding response OmpR family regulator
LLKRSRLDDDLDDETGAAPGDTILVLNPDADAGELVARLVELAGFPALRFLDQASLIDQLAEGGVTAIIIDSLGTGISAAFEALEAVRAGPPASRDTAVMILATTDTNRLYAYQSGVDAYLVRPFHADDLIGTVRTTLARSTAEREGHRRDQLLGGASAP